MDAIKSGLRLYVHACSYTKQLKSQVYMKWQTTPPPLKRSWVDWCVSLNWKNKVTSSPSELEYYLHFTPQLALSTCFNDPALIRAINRLMRFFVGEKHLLNLLTFENLNEHVYIILYVVYMKL